MTQTLENQLNQVQQKLEALETEYQDFAYVVSHDLSSPLRAIKGFSEIILDNHINDFDDATKKHFNLVISCAHRSQKILESLLAFSRLNTVTEPFSEINCHEAIDDAKMQLSKLFTKTGGTISMSDLPVINGDRHQIILIFYHLIKNALIYQAVDNTPHVSIVAKDLGKYCQFSIIDNGIGVKEELAERIFKPLQRGVKDSEFPGIGMGLTLVKKIIQRHNGFIRVESNSTPGSIFHFSIPKSHD